MDEVVMLVFGVRSLVKFVNHINKIIDYRQYKTNWMVFTCRVGQNMQITKNIQIVYDRNGCEGFGVHDGLKRLFQVSGPLIRLKRCYLMIYLILQNFGNLYLQLFIIQMTSTSLFIYLLLLIQVYHTTEVIKREEPFFPKILWIFWNEDLEHAHFFTRMCINNMHHYAKESNWQLRFMTDQNITMYLSKQSQRRIENIKQTKHFTMNYQQSADLYRLFLIYEHGGYWLDANSYFVGNFSWLENLQKETEVVNRLDSPPEFLAFTYFLYSGNKSRTFDRTFNKQIEFFPGIEIWSFASIKQGLFLKDLLENIQYSMTKDMDDLIAENAKNGLKHSFQDHPNFVLSNFNFQIVMQRKQKEIDNHPQKFKTKYAVDYYKIWSFEGQKSGFSHGYLYAQDETSIFDMMSYTSLDGYVEPNHFKRYFLKNNGGIATALKSSLDLLPYLLCTEQVQKLPQDSILNQLLFSHSQNIKEVQILTKLNAMGKMDLNSQQCWSKLHELQSKVIKIVLLAMLIVLGWFFLVRFSNKIEEQPSFQAIDDSKERI